MIFGHLNRSSNPTNTISRSGFAPAARKLESVRIVYSDENIYLASDTSQKSEKDNDSNASCCSDRIVAVISGHIYNWQEIQRKTKRFDVPAIETKVLSVLYEQIGIKVLSSLDGKFALGIWDRLNRTLLLARDPLGIEPVYYYADRNKFVFSSVLSHILIDPAISKSGLNFAAMAKFLMFNYNPGIETFYNGVKKLRAGHFLIVNESGVQIERYWKPAFGLRSQLSQDELVEIVRIYLEEAVKKRVDCNKRQGVFISGGLDSSTVLSLTSKFYDRKINTFSYRCKAVSFDESRYAKQMAESIGAIHNELEYKSSDVLKLVEIVKAMDEPFCDAGINIATHILGCAAQGEVDYLFTGDGGDELFGGHPIYEADKISRWLDPLPNVIKYPVLNILSHLPDSDKKKSMLIKVKRFAESMKFPAELLSHRWRIYYYYEDFERLFTPEIWAKIKHFNLYEDMFCFTQESDGKDLLSRSLYSDYQTVVDFYLRRNDLNRTLGLQTHYPMLDQKLVELCATIPSNLKIKGWFDTKFILKKAVEGLLPGSILHRKDKLGHSIPLKKWIRESDEVQEFVLETISAQKLEQRGFFQPEAVNRMIDEHLQRKRNNSHRLWSLTVLETWLAYQFDNNHMHTLPNEK